MTIAKKIILGSANFNQKYGIKKNFIKRHEIKKLLNLCLKFKIRTIDTSPIYSNSEKIIGTLGNGRFKIISKIPKKPKNIKKKQVEKWMKKNVINSLKNLKLKSFDTLLLHDTSSLLKNEGSEIYKSLKNLKSDGFTKKIGISIYDFRILNKILRKFKFDLIQAPLNILDRRLVEKGWLNKIKERKMEVHVRSIFLQGILLLKSNQLPQKLEKLKENWKIWDNWLNKNHFNSLQVCLSYVLKHKKIDGIIIGHNNKNQLNEILNFKRIKKKFFLPNLNIKNKKLIDPIEWLKF